MNLKIVAQRIKDEKLVIIYSVSCIVGLMALALVRNVDGAMFGSGMVAIGGVLGWYFKAKVMRHKNGQDQ